MASASQVIEPDDSDRPHSHLKTNHSAEVVDSSSGKRITAAVAPRRELSGHYIEGPALLTELQTTTFIPAGYFGWITDQGHLRVQASLNLSHSDSASEGLSELQRDIMRNRLIAVVQEQATTLVRSAIATSTREAGDLSAGLFDPTGRMLAQSVTGTPGHVNSMAASVGHFLDVFPMHLMEPGDIYLTNDTWKGTGHLFDVVVVNSKSHCT